MSEPPLHYPDWKAPAEDGGLLVWPEPDQLLRQTLENHRRLSREDNVVIQGVPLNQVRTRLRQFIGHDERRPLLASGHQTELYHPGVWAKDALIGAAARRIEGAAYHLAVDTDAPKHLVLRWPGGSVPITDDATLTTAAWSGQLALPTPAHLDAVGMQFREAASGWSVAPLLSSVLESLRRLALESGNLSSALTNAQHELDWTLGLRHHALLASPLWLSEPFLLFAHHMLAHADRVAADYNRALSTYRAAYGVRSSSRPMPDLFIGDDATEMPFWLDDLSTGRRVRPSVFRAGGAFVLQLINGEEFVFDRSAAGWEASSKLLRFLASTAHRLAPRALTLTMFVRLCLADQFVHGIGGGRYDQVTDHLISTHFDLEPPTFSVTTVTLYFAEASGRQRVCVPCVRHEGHRLRHALLGARKRDLVSQIASLPRHSPQRAAAFLAMHAELDAVAAEHPAMAHWRDRLDAALQQQREEQSLFDREMFYAIQPRERLHDLIRRYNALFAAPEP